MIHAYFSGDKTFSNTQESFSLYEKSCFGEKKEGRIEYSSFEALFLLQEKKIQILSNKKPLSFDFLLKKIKKHDKRIDIKLTAFSDLRKRGYIIKTALKYGADFRVYEKGYKPSESHARWLLFAVKESSPLSWHEFAAKNRIAHSTKKALLIAIIDEESDVSYYECQWLRP